MNELVPHDNADTVGCTVAAAIPLSLIEVVFETEPWAAVSVTVWDDDTDATLAVKFTLVAPEGTVTDAGTLSEVLLLERLTVTPALVAAELMVTVQLSVPAPLIDELAQLNPVSDAVAWEEPLPCSLIQPDVLFVLISAVILSSPL